ncbi:MAG: hypothetical protein P8179_12230 [Candidatus Thiodiazotropha sp.]
MTILHETLLDELSVGEGSDMEGIVGKIFAEVVSSDHLLTQQRQEKR